MFKQFLITLIQFTTEIPIQQGKIKYPINTFISLRDSVVVPLSRLKNKQNYLFYTTQKWSTKNNNYIYDKTKRYYHIIEPGYYYYLYGDIELTVNNEIDIYIFNF